MKLRDTDFVRQWIYRQTELIDKKATISDCSLIYFTKVITSSQRVVTMAVAVAEALARTTVGHYSTMQIGHKFVSPKMKPSTAVAIDRGRSVR